ncbi:MAG TPA: biotin/lipoyl-binding protein [Microbacterium sp.]|nr:biotin/lipoyl-binding protein [Microbacterium sp.]
MSEQEPATVERLLIPPAPPVRTTAPRRRRRAVWWTAGGVAVVVAVAGGIGIASAASASANAPDYRTATVGTGPVTQTLELTGTVSRANQKTASFPVSGTVASVSVGVGDTVRAGQKLATLDPTALKANLLAAQATLARDEASLAADQTGSSTTSTTAGSATGTAVTAATGGSTGRTAGAGTTALQAQLARADRALGQIRSELAQANTLCAPVTGAVPKTGGTGTRSGAGPTGTGAIPAPTPSPTASPTSTPTPTPSTSSSTGTGSGASTATPAQVAACEQALASIAGSLQTTEQQVSALARALSASASRGSSTSSASGTARSSGSGTGGSASGATSQAARVASDQAAIAQDEASVVQAKADVQDATLTAPISGTVAFVGFVTGTDAATSQGITVIGAGAAVVTVDIPLADMSLMHAGLAARVTPAGGASSVAGSVQSVQLLPSSSASSTAFPATVTVADPPTALASGSAATVSIVTATATNAVRVPASALSGRDGRTGVVTVLSGSNATRTAVQLGAVGGGWVQVTSGLKAGQQVVLADAGAALPSNTTGLGGRGLGGGGGFRTGTGGTFRSGAGG